MDWECPKQPVTTDKYRPQAGSQGRPWAPCDQHPDMSTPEVGVSRGSPCAPRHGLAGVTGLRFLSTPGVQLIPCAGAAGVTLLPPALLPTLMAPGLPSAPGLSA